MDDKGEEYCGLFGDAIKDEHRLDSEMPGAGSVGRGNKDGEGADAEDEEAGEGGNIAGEVEGEEGQVEVEIIARPDANAVEEVEGKVVHLAKRHEAVDEALHAVVDLTEEM